MGPTPTYSRAGGLTTDKLIIEEVAPESAMILKGFCSISIMISV
jgi:hypothetical protein